MIIEEKISKDIFKNGRENEEVNKKVVKVACIVFNVEPNTVLAQDIFDGDINVKVVQN